jgi:hypothetical protein
MADSRTTLNTDIDLRHLLDIPKHVAKRRSTTASRPFHSLAPCRFGQAVAVLLGPIVETVIETVAVAVLALRVTASLAAQVGGSTPPLGLEVTAQVNETVPA